MIYILISLLFPILSYAQGLKITQLPTLTNPGIVSTDLMVIVDNSSYPPLTKSIAISELDSRWLQNGAVWGNITGSLSSQTDLSTALGLKANTSSLATVATSGHYSDLLGVPNAAAIVALFSGCSGTQYLGADGACHSASSGSVTSVSVASANGFGGSSSGGSTPALTLTTSVSGLLKGNGTAISAATSGTDYVVPSGNITGTAANVTGTSNSTLTTLSGLTTASSLSSVGTITSGNWSGTAISSAHGGTGVDTSTATGIPVVSGGTWYVDTTLPTVQGGLGGNFGYSTGALSMSSGVVSAGVLSIANGGTDNGSLPVTAGGVLYTDGTQFQNVGAGTSGQVLSSNGSGAPAWVNPNGNTSRNVLLNPGFETGPTTSWTLSGATATANTTNYHDGAQSVSLALSAGGSLCQYVTPGANFSGTNMEAGMWVNTTNSTATVCAAQNGSVLTGNYCNVVPSSGSWVYVPANSVGPASGTSVGVCLVWTGSSGTILADQAYVGQATNLGNTNATTTSQNYTLTVGGVSSAPTPGSGAISSASWYRDGENMYIHYVFSQTNAGSGGSGTYLFPIPAGYTIDSSKVTFSTNAIGMTGSFVGPAYSSLTATANATQAVPSFMVPYDSTHLAMISANNAQTLYPVGSNNFTMNSSPLYLSFDAKIPIVQFAAAQTSVQMGCASNGSCVNHLSASVTTACTSNPCTIATQYPNWLTSINRVSTGQYAANFVSGFFTTTPACTISTTQQGVQIGSVSTSSFSFDTLYLGGGGAFSDSAFTISCDKQGSDVSSMNAPIIRGGVSSDSVGAWNVESISFGGTSSTFASPVSCSSSPCTIMQQSGNFSSVTRNSTGQYVINAPSGKYSGPFVCWGNAGNLNSVVTVINATSTAFTFNMVNVGNGAATDCQPNLFCTGPR